VFNSLSLQFRASPICSIDLGERIARGGVVMSNVGRTRARYARNRAGKPIKLKIGGRRVPKSKRVIPKATLRCRDLDLYFDDRYGPVLPDDDAGREDVMIYLNHLAHKQDDRQAAMHEWLDQRAPWLVGDARKAYIAKVFRKPIMYRADTLAQKLGLTFARRQRLGITTIGAIDVSKEERQEMRKAKARDRMRKVRHGGMSREEYEGQSISRQKPWIAEGISRPTWYRRQQEQLKTHYAQAREVMGGNLPDDR
jgi:hypothetical protein